MSIRKTSGLTASMPNVAPVNISSIHSPAKLKSSTLLGIPSPTVSGTVSGFNTFPSFLPPSITFAGTSALFVQDGNSSNYDVINANQVNALEISTGSLYAYQAEAFELYANNISTLYLDLDGNILTTDNVGPAGELLLNGIPIATTANLSNIADWSLYNAISTIDCVFNNIDKCLNLNVSSINGQPLISSITNWSLQPAIQSVNMNSNSLYSTNTISFRNNNILTVNPGNFLTYNGTVINTGSFSGVTSLNDLSNEVNLTSTDNSVVITKPNTSTINLASTGGGSTSNWATFVATADVQFGFHSLTISGQNDIITPYTTSQLDTNIKIGATAYTFRPTFDAIVSDFNVGSLVSPVNTASINATGAININSLEGVNMNGAGGIAIDSVGGISVLGGGDISLTGGGAIIASGATVDIAGGILNVLGGAVDIGGGAVNIGSGLLNILTGNIAIASGAIECGTGNITLGVAATPGGSVNIYGGGVNLYNTTNANNTNIDNTTISVADAIDSVVIVANQVSVTGSSESTEMTAGSIELTNTLFTQYVKPYPTGPLTITAGGALGSDLVTLQNVASITSYSSNLAINGLATINGAPYTTPYSSSNPPPLISTFTTLNVSQTSLLSSITADLIDGQFVFGVDINASGSLVASNVFLSSINGVAYPGPANNTSNWSLYPAISDILIGVSSIIGGPAGTDTINFTALGLVLDTSLGNTTINAGTLAVNTTSAVNITSPTLSVVAGIGSNLLANFGSSSNDTIILQGNTRLDWGLLDGTGVAGTVGQVLTTTGSNTLWATLPVNPSASYFEYQARTTSQSGNPGSGHILWNTVSQTSATQINVSHLTFNSIDIDLFLAQIVSGNTYIIQDADDSTRFQTWTVTGSTTILPNSYVIIPSAIVSSAGADFTNNQRIILILVSSGNSTVNAGLQNKLQIVPALSGQTVSSITYSTGGSPVGSPSSWVPFSAEAQPITGGNNSGWRNFRQVNQTGTTYKVEWFPYNPYFGVSLPYTVNPSPTIHKKDLRSLWAVIYTKNRINIQGVLFFNVYTYDIANPPTSPANTFTNRFDYNIYLNPTTVGVVAGQTALAGGFRYLICAVDSPKIVPQTTVTVAAASLVTGTTYTILVVGTTNWTAIGADVAQIGCVFIKNATAVTGTGGTATTDVSTTILVGNGQYPSQSSTEKLSDPYDIFTDLTHIPFSAVNVASNSPQPADPASVAISAICVATTSSAITPTLDFTVEAIGYSTSVGENYRYDLTF